MHSTERQGVKYCERLENIQKDYFSGSGFNKVGVLIYMSSSNPYI